MSKNYTVIEDGACPQFPEIHYVRFLLLWRRQKKGDFLEVLYLITQYKNLNHKNTIGKNFIKIKNDLS